MRRRTYDMRITVVPNAKQCLFFEETSIVVNSEAQNFPSPFQLRTDPRSPYHALNTSTIVPGKVRNLTGTFKQKACTLDRRLPRKRSLTLSDVPGTPN